MDERIEIAAGVQQNTEICCENSSAENTEAVERREWYQDISLEDTEAFISSSLQAAARNVIAIGYYLKHIRDNELFREAGYENIWDYAQGRYGFSRSTASRYMTRNDRFSKGGNSPILDSKYKDYNKSQLQEMLSLNDEQLEQVTPDMTVREIREIRQPKAIPYFEIEGQLEFETDFPDIVPLEAPEVLPPIQPATFTMDVSDLLDGVATSHTETEEEVHETDKTERKLKKPSGAESVLFDHAAKLLIRTNKDWFLQDYHKRVLNVTTSGTELLNLIRPNHRWWHFNDGKGDMYDINLFDGYVQLWSGSTCIGDFDWFYLSAAIQRMWNVVALEDASAKEEQTPDPGEQGVLPEEEPEEEQHPEEPEESSAIVKEYDRKILAEMIKSEEETLEMMQDYWRQNQPWTYTRYAMMIQAYKELMAAQDVRQASGEDEDDLEQPELPVLRNNDQRKEWLETFHDWPVWFKVPEASEVYYRYDLPDGTSFVICEYQYWVAWREKYDYGISPECVGTREYLLKPGYHYLYDCKVSRTEMIEKLKELQKKG